MPLFSHAGIQQPRCSAFGALEIAGVHVEGAQPVCRRTGRGNRADPAQGNGAGWERLDQFLLHFISV